MKLKTIENKIVPNDFKQDQITAINHLAQFINDPETLKFTLSGAAGTGKTYMLKWFVNNLCKFATCVTAPTHKAVRVIENTLLRKGKTIQSLHGLRPNFDLANFDINNPQFDPRGIQRIGDYKLVIIDEASMITDDIDKLNTQRAKEYNVKILYVGDPLQLPAVTKNNNQVNPQDTLVFQNPNQFTLREIVRQEDGHPLLKLFPIVRDDIEKSSSNLLPYLFNNRESLEGDVGYSIINELKYTNSIDKLFDKEKFLSNPDSVRMLAYTNESVGVNNTLIRNKILNSPKDIIVPEDILTAYTTIVDEFNYPIIINSEDYRINTIRKYQNADGIDTFAINLQSTYDMRLTNVLQVVDHTSATFLIYYSKVLELYKDAVLAGKENKKEKWSKFFKYKESILTMVSFQLSVGNYKTTIKKDIDYAYAITVHKAQGSTFNDVILDLRDIAYYKKLNKYVKRFDNNIVNRLIYVGLSRAQNKVLMKL